MKGKNEVVIGLMKDELFRKIMRDFDALKEKRYSYLKDNDKEDRKSKRYKKAGYKTKS